MADGPRTEKVVMRVRPAHRKHRGMYWRSGGRGYTDRVFEAGTWWRGEEPKSDRAEPIGLNQALKDHENV